MQAQLGTLRHTGRPCAGLSRTGGVDVNHVSFKMQRNYVWDRRSMASVESGERAREGGFGDPKRNIELK